LKNYSFLACLAEGHDSLCHGAASVVRRPSGVNFFHLNDFFSRTTRPIFQPNLTENMFGRLGFTFVQIKGMVPFGAQ